MGLLKAITGSQLHGDYTQLRKFLYNGSYHTIITSLSQIAARPKRYHHMCYMNVLRLVPGFIYHNTHLTGNIIRTIEQYL